MPGIVYCYEISPACQTVFTCGFLYHLLLHGLDHVRVL